MATHRPVNRACQWLVIFFLTVLLTPSVPGAEPHISSGNECVSNFENGSVNWTTGIISGVGRAEPDQQDNTSGKGVYPAARSKAVENLLEVFKQIKINNELNVGDYATDHPIILAGLEKTAREAVVAGQIYSSAMALEMTVQTAMSGGFLQLVLPEEIRQIPRVNPEIQPDMDRYPEKKSYSGLIIDARGLGIEPVLDPVVVSEQGDDVYSSVFISREFAVQNGVCKYICNMTQALQDPLVGPSPLVLKALRREGKQNATIVMSMSDYHALEKVTERHHFFNECRVIVVRDQ